MISPVNAKSAKPGIRNRGKGVPGARKKYSKTKLVTIKLMHTIHGGGFLQSEIILSLLSNATSRVQAFQP